MSAGVEGSEGASGAGASQVSGGGEAGAPAEPGTTNELGRAAVTREAAPRHATDHGWDGLTLERLDGGVSVLSIDRPERMNSVTASLFTELGDAVRQIARDGTRALVLTATGDRAFSAGYDLGELPELLETTVQEFLSIEDVASSAVGAIHALPIPVVAAVNGAASGGGLSLALAADIRLAAATATFNAAFVRVGFSVGELGTSWLLTRVVGPGMAAELAYTGRIVRADEALAIGLCDRVVEADHLRGEAIALATRLSDPARSALIGKRTLASATESASFAVGLRQGLPDRL